MGVQVDLLTYGEGSDVDLPNVRIIRIPRIPFLRTIPVGPSIPKIFLDILIALWTIGLLLRRRYDFVHAHEESVFLCQYLKFLFRFKLVYDMHSSLPQQLTNFAFTKSKILIGLFDRLETHSLALADAVITISPALAEYAKSRMSHQDRHFLIENSLFEEVRLTTSTAAGATGSAPVPSLPEDRKVVAYAGTFESYQGLHLLIPAFAQVHERKVDAFLLMIGGSPNQVDRYRGLAVQLGIEDHCLFTGILDQSTTRRLLQRAQVLTSPRSEGTNTPLKVYEQLASGQPLVATRVPSHTQILSDEVCFMADPDPESLAEAILEALENPTRSARTVKAAQRLYEEAYSRSAYEQKMKQLLECLS